MVHLGRCRLNPPKKNTNASNVPPVKDRNSLSVRFCALDAAVVLTVRVEV